MDGEYRVVKQFHGDCGGELVTICRTIEEAVGLAMQENAKESEAYNKDPDPTFTGPRVCYAYTPEGKLIPLPGEE